MNLIEVLLQGIPISEEQCIGDSLEFINMAFASLTGSMRSMQLTISSDFVKPVQLSKLSNAFASQGQVITYDATTSTWVPSAAFKLPTNAYSGQVLTFDSSTNSWIPSATVRIQDELPKNATDGQVLAYYDSTKSWLPKDSFALPSTEINGQVLAYNATTSSWQPSSLPPNIQLPLSLDKLSITGASRGYVITYDVSTASWVASAAPGSGLIPLEKIIATGAVAGNAIVYDPATQTWVPSAVAPPLPTDALPGQVLTYDGTTNSWRPSATAVVETTIPLTRISTAGATNRDVITYDSYTNTWVTSALLPTAITGQVLTYDSSSNTWIPSAAPMPTNFVTLSRNTIVGNGGTTYTLTNYPSENAEDYIVVVDGIVQIAAEAYTVDVGGILTFANPIPIGSKIVVIMPRPANVVSINVPTFRKNIISTTANVATYTLVNYTNNNPDNYLVYLNGIMQAPGEDYTVTGSQITLIPTPAPGSSLLVMALMNDGGTQAGTTNNSQLFTDGSGKVGVGTSTPTERLTVKGNISASGVIYSTNSTFVNSISAPSLSGTLFGNIFGNTAQFEESLYVVSLTASTGTFTTSVSTQSLSSTIIRGREATFTQTVSAPIIRGVFYGDGSNLTDAGGAGNIRAWVNFNGEGTSILIRDSRNVSSVTDVGAGTYIVNFTKHLPNANYALVGSTPPLGSVGSTMYVRTVNINPSNLPTAASCPIRVLEWYQAPSSGGLVMNYIDAQYIHCAFIS